MFKDEIFNKDHDIESYLISHFENSKSILKIITNKKNYINEYIKDTQNIVDLISEIKLSNKDLKNYINVMYIINYKI